MINRRSPKDKLHDHQMFVCLLVGWLVLLVVCLFVCLFCKISYMIIGSSYDGRGQHLLILSQRMVFANTLSRGQNSPILSLRMVFANTLCIGHYLLILSLGMVFANTLCRGQHLLILHLKAKKPDFILRKISCNVGQCNITTYMFLIFTLFISSLLCSSCTRSK